MVLKPPQWNKPFVSLNALLFVKMTESAAS